VLKSSIDSPGRVHMDSSVLCLGGSLGGIDCYCELILSALKEGGHVFRHVEVISDVAQAGAWALVAA